MRALSTAQALALSILLAWPLATCAAAPGGIRGLADEAYIGTVIARVLPPPDSGVRATRRSGPASGSLASDGRLVVAGDIDREADAGFTAKGTFSGGAWSGASGGVRLEIAADGRITGGGMADGNRMRIDGRLDERELEVLFEVELAEASPGGFPPGTRFSFEFDLRRQAPGAAVDAGDRAGEGCSRVEYRLKLVPNLGGGTMGMVRVPECIR